jgi:hypothetical protein
MIDVGDAIKKLGGLKKASLALKVPYTTVQYWMHQNRLPAWRLEQVKAALTTAPKNDAKSKRSAA